MRCRTGQRWPAVTRADIALPSTLSIFASATLKTFIRWTGTQRAMPSRVLRLATRSPTATWSYRRQPRAVRISVSVSAQNQSIKVNSVSSLR